MSRLEIMSPTRARIVMEGLYKDLERRIESSPPGLCPVDMARAFLELCHAQTCGKCVPCRIGLGQLNQLIRDVLNGKATMDTLDLMEKTALSIMDSADCAIGYEAANMVYKGLIGYRDDYVEHIRNGRCTCTYNQPVPCVAICPAHVDIPGYVALVEEGRYADAIRLIRKDNPFPTTCGFICEHPCVARCRRNMVDDAVNIRGLKRNVLRQRERRSLSSAEAPEALAQLTTYSLWDIRLPFMRCFRSLAACSATESRTTVSQRIGWMTISTQS